MSFLIVRHTVAASGVIGALLLTESALPSPDRFADAAVSTPAPTIHPPVARDASRLWMAPPSTDRTATIDPAVVQLQAALRLYADGKYEHALRRFAAAAVPDSPLRAYAAYYVGAAELRLERFEAARRRFAALKDTDGFVGEAAALGEAEAAHAMGEFGDAAEIYEDILDDEGAVDLPAIWLSLATAALADGDRKQAAEAFLHLYYEFPLSEHAVQAERALQSLPEVQQIASRNRRYKLELKRGERLFESQRYADARASFLRLKPYAESDDAELVSLRLAEIDYFLRRYRNARESLRAFLTRGARQDEARFFYLMSQRGLRNYATFERLVRALERDFPESTWAEEALNNLATFYIQRDRDDEADAVFREMYARFPRGRHAERAAWKAGWTSYRSGDLREAVRYFESASASFPRSNYRPAWLYWSGRARTAMGDESGGLARYRLTVADYHNTYYGRLAEAILKEQGVPLGSSNLVFASSAASGTDDEYFPPTEDTIRMLLAAGLYEPAVKELEFARAKWGDSPAITATLAWANKQMAAAESGSKEFTLARGSITLIKRAYPQFMAYGGDQLPREILTTIFPLEYWDLIRKHAAANKLDPYLVAALMAQESTFVPDIKSHAGAYGLMQMMPSTGRRYARKLKLRYSVRLLTTPETNIRMGTMYLADKIREFGSVHLALASYNAGETPVRRWMREHPGLPQDEFIESISYPETQHYVKRLLGTAEDYRRLYGN